jgi:hypothetical protein
LDKRKENLCNPWLLPGVLKTIAITFRPSFTLCSFFRDSPTTAIRWYVSVESSAGLVTTRRILNITQRIHAVLKLGNAPGQFTGLPFIFNTSH